MVLRQDERALARPRDAELEHRVSLELDGVRAVVERRREARVDVRDVEALEVVVHVERPVRFDQVVASSGGVEGKVRERQARQPRAHRRRDVVERHRRRERDHQESLQAVERDGRQVVGLRWEVRGPLELGHRVEASVEAEATPVVAAAQLLQVRGALDHERPAMGADVREAVEAILAIAREQERLVQRSGQQREGEHLAGDADDVVVSGVLPRPREHLLPLERERLRIRVDTRRQRLGHPDVGIDLEPAGAHRRMVSAGPPVPLTVGRRSPNALRSGVCLTPTPSSSTRTCPTCWAPAAGRTARSRSTRRSSGRTSRCSCCSTTSAPRACGTGSRSG